MSSKRTTEEWRHNLASLKKVQLSSSIEDDLFAILKYSYDNLPDESTRKCLLFSALYPEDWLVFSIEFIHRLWLCDVIDTEDCNDISEVYDRAQHHIGVLKAACLLEPYDVCGLSYFKLHDFIRDMALWITCNCGGNNVKWVVRAGLDSHKPLKGVNNWEDAERLSLMDNNITSLSIPTRRCEKLSTLFLQRNNSLERLPEDLFHYFPALSYLDLSHTAITEIPNEITALVELRYLNLHSTKIRSLSLNLRELKKLKHLMLHCCVHLTYIPYGLISQFPKLQFLDISGSAYIFRRENFDRDENLCITKCTGKDENLCRNENGMKDDESAMANVEELILLKKHGQIKALGLNLEIKSVLDLQNVVEDASIAWLSCYQFF